MVIKTRKPTGRVPWPLVLVEGGEKAGKSWAAAILSASPRVGRTLWIDLGEGSGDEYGAIPGVRYEIVEHDGTWKNILANVEEIRDEARRIADAGQPPLVLVIDSMTLIWDMLKDWASNRARSAPANQKLLAKDPNAEINVSSNFWNDANARHRKLMTLLMTFPGIVVVTARGKEVTAMTNGQPDPKKPKDYRVEGHKDLGFDATVWVRLSRTEHPAVIGARSVHAGIVPGEDRPIRKPGLTLEQVIFDILRCKPAEAHTRELVELQPGDAGPDGESPAPDVVGELTTRIAGAGDRDQLAAAWRALGAADDAGELLPGAADQLKAAWNARRDQLFPPPSAAEPSQAAEQGGGQAVPMIGKGHYARMNPLWKTLQYDGDAKRANRLQAMEVILKRPVATSKELTAADAEMVIEGLKARIEFLRKQAAEKQAAEAQAVPA